MAATVAPLRDVLVDRANEEIIATREAPFGPLAEARDRVFYARTDDEAAEILRGQPGLLALVAGKG